MGGLTVSACVALGVAAAAANLDRRDCHSRGDGNEERSHIRTSTPKLIVPVVPPKPESTWEWAMRGKGRDGSGMISGR